jgi:hypothetical protein
VAQIGGAVAGSIVGSAFYLVLIPDPAAMLCTPEWPAPAVAMWKAVAEVFRRGLESLPPDAGLAMIVAGIAGVVFPVLEKVLPRGRGVRPQLLGRGSGLRHLRHQHHLDVHRRVIAAVVAGDLPPSGTR